MFRRLARQLSGRLAADRKGTTRARDRKARPAVDGLEGRQMLTTGLAMPHPIAAPPAAVSLAATTATTPAPSSAQTGSSLGLAWRFVPTGNSYGDGTLYIQDTARGTDSLDPKDEPIWINQTASNLVLDYDEALPFNGPAVKPHAYVKVVVADANGQASGGGDIQVLDDRGANLGGSLSYLQDAQSGHITVAGDSNVSWKMSYNIATQQQTYTLDSGSYAGRLNIQDAYSGADQYENHGNPNQVIGFNVTDSQGNGGGASNVIAGATVTIKVKGSAQWHNSSSFAMVQG